MLRTMPRKPKQGSTPPPVGRLDFAVAAVIALLVSAAACAAPEPRWGAAQGRQVEGANLFFFPFSAGEYHDITEWPTNVTVAGQAVPNWGYHGGRDGLAWDFAPVVRGTTGDLVRATADGVVTAAGYGAVGGCAAHTDCGVNYVVIEHPSFGLVPDADGVPSPVYSLYMHLAPDLATDPVGGCAYGVQLGTTDHPTRVIAGQPIGCLGDTGGVTGPHLHFTFQSNRNCASPSSGAPAIWCTPIDYLMVEDAGFADVGVLVPGSGAPHVDQSAAEPKLNALRQAAAAEGLYNGLLLAGVANQESAGLNHCYTGSFCQGPPSPECANGLLAGGGDGTCAQGGLGAFQFDAGTQAGTLALYDCIDANDPRDLDIRTFAGSVRAAVDFVASRLIQDGKIPGCTAAYPSLDSCTYDLTPACRQAAIGYMNGVRPRTRAYQDWLDFLVRRYNGCQPGSDVCSYDRAFGQYDHATYSLYEAMGARYWYAYDDSWSPPTMGTAPATTGKRCRLYQMACAEDEPLAIFICVNDQVSANTAQWDGEQTSGAAWSVTTCAPGLRCANRWRHMSATRDGDGSPVACGVNAACPDAHVGSTLGVRCVTDTTTSRDCTEDSTGCVCSYGVWEAGCAPRCEAGGNYVPVGATACGGDGVFECARPDRIGDNGAEQWTQLGTCEQACVSEEIGAAHCR